MDVQKNSNNPQNNQRLALYPGVFKYFHEGNFDLVQRSLNLFDQILILVCGEPNEDPYLYERAQKIAAVFEDEPRVGVGYWTGLLVQYIQDTRVEAILRPLKDSTDLSKERAYIYTNEDLGMKTPIIYIPISRNLSHITSRTYEKIENFTEQGGSNAGTN